MKEYVVINSIQGFRSTVYTIAEAKVTYYRYEDVSKQKFTIYVYSFIKDGGAVYSGIYNESLYAKYSGFEDEAWDLDEKCEYVSKFFLNRKKLWRKNIELYRRYLDFWKIMHHYGVFEKVESFNGDRFRSFTEIGITELDIATKILMEK